ncbi:MAG: Mannan endo-1,4-beta-mannosidase precursor [Bacteroidetes bacterium ADurb.BinA174]|nr:MAG: Mannan endo-1,4-beta-mannosidase precursor [Bacteroidetes bacterium ADurb.BinA174]
MNKLFFFTSLLLSLFLITCTSKQKESNNLNEPTLDNKTAETQNLLKNLKLISQKGFMFGHQDDPLYGIGWNGDSARSDVKSVVGDYPAAMGFDIGHIELSGDRSLDNVWFDRIRQEIINQYNRGGMSTVSWHLDNPLTGGNSWDVKTKGVVASILPNGEQHEKFLGWLDIVANFFNSLTTENGIKVPVLFRPWHEHTGSWFWWGKDLCTADEYKQLWIMTHDYLAEQGVDNLLYAYSPDSQGPGEIYMERYPGDEYVDVLGFDCYHRNNVEGIEAYQHSLNTILAFMAEEGKKRNKPIALTETGLESIPIADWWTKVLFSVLDRYPVSYVLVWRNAHDIPNHYYAPYPEQVSANDFVKFYENPKTLFCNDIRNLYN